jgi:uncharacterized protein (UPF0147 family)
MKIRSTAIAALLTVLVGMASGGEPAGTKPENRDRIPELKEDATGGLTRDRLKAIDSLGSISDEKRLSQFGVPDFLLNILKDADNNSMVREAAADALAKIIRYVPTFTDKALRPLVSRLQDSRGESLSVRRKIARAMAGFLDPDSISHRNAYQALMRIAASSTDEPGLIAEVLRTLGSTGYGKAMSVVTTALRNKDDQVRAAALEALEALLSSGKLDRPNDVVAILVQIISDEAVPEKLRIKAMVALVATMRAGVPVNRVAAPLVAALGKAAEKKQPELAKAVVKALHRVPDGNSVKALDAAYDTFLKTPKAKGFEDVRVAIALTLGEYFHPLARKNDKVTADKVAKTLLKICQKEPMDHTRAVKAAIFALSMMDSKKLDRTAVVWDLIDAMERDKDVTREAHASLVRIIGKDLGRKPKDWKKWYKENKNTLLPQGRG